MSTTTRPDQLAVNDARDFRNPARRAAALAAAIREREAADAADLRTYRDNVAQMAAQTDRTQPRRGLFDMPGTRDADEPLASDRCRTVYAVALIYQPRESAGADPIVILRQFVRDGRRPLTDREVITHAADLERDGWKMSRAPLELFNEPTGIVCYQVIPSFV